MSKKKIRVCKRPLCNNTNVDRHNKGGYCCHYCWHQHKYEKNLEDWFSGEISGHKNCKNLQLKDFVRRYVFEKYGERCSLCGFEGYNQKTGNTIIQIDHIDGNKENSTPENLRTLCPNCHAMTPTFMALNKGNGRKFRYSE